MLSILTFLPLSLSLSTDAFAASLAVGAKAPHRKLRNAIKSGLTFGLAEGLMCLLGFGMGAYFAGIIQAFDHWIALILLTVIGVRMIQEGLNHDDEDNAPHPTSFIGTIITAIGTSIDAAAVGIALAMAGTSIWVCLLIGTTSFIISTVGFLIAPLVGARLGHRTEIIGGIVLIAIGVSIFCQHTIWA
ncbi:manganese efflux pump MntP family protein [Hirschia litorea]|uniref:Putative manganese efflux pump MntP n=1 Tax=Hirschia litorea TaxID=1199156 RepID=A0ABW2IQ84_9PROT